MNTAQCNRRDFLAMTGLAAAAGVAPGCLSQKVAKNEQTFLWGTLIHFGMNNWFSKPLQQCPFPGGLNAAQREAVRLEYGRADHVRSPRNFGRPIIRLSSMSLNAFHTRAIQNLR